MGADGSAMNRADDVAVRKVRGVVTSFRDDLQWLTAVRKRLVYRQR